MAEGFEWFKLQHGNRTLAGIRRPLKNGEPDVANILSFALRHIMTFGYSHGAAVTNK